MVSIIHINTHFNDNRGITALEVKLKYIQKESEKEQDQYLVAAICKAFYDTTLLPNEGKRFNICVNPKRPDIVNLNIKFKENSMTIMDIANFINTFQQALDEIPS